MNEEEIIRRLAAHFPRERDAGGGLFACDAELVRIGSELWGLTLDAFSPEEDLFGTDDPAALGANLAVATLSDLLAAGATPRFFLQAVAVPRDVSASFLDGLAEGVRGVLDEAGCALCGGDVGTAEAWRFSGFAMGPIVAPRPLTHRVPAAPQTLWVTGALGDANVAALQGRPAPRLELRLREAALIRRHATACIDTSGGLLAALWLLHTLSLSAVFTLDLDRVPYAPGVRAVAATAGLPAEAALLGGAGEYELLFTTDAALGGEARDALGAAGVTPIGTVHAEAGGGVRFARDGRPAGALTAPPPCPRAAASAADHVRDVLAAAAGLFGPGAAP